MNGNPSWWTQHWKGVKTALVTLLPWLVTAAAIAAFLVSSQLTGEHAALCRSIGSALLAGGVFTFLLKFLQFTRAFRQEIADYFRDPAFGEALTAALFLTPATSLGKKAEQEFWTRITRNIVGSRFPRLADGVATSVAGLIFGEGHEAYYSKFEREIEVQNYDSQSKLLTFTDRLTLVIHLRDGETTVLEGSMQLIVGKTKPTYELIELSANEVDHLPSLVRGNVEDGKQQVTYKLTLGSSAETIDQAGGCILNVWTVKRAAQRVAAVPEDPCDVVRLARLTQSLHVTVKIPKDLPVSARLAGLGMSKDSVKIETKSSGGFSIYKLAIEKRLILPNSGYTLTWLT